MMQSGIAAPASLFRSTVAEFLKFYAFRIPQIAYVSIVAFLVLFVFQLFLAERLLAHLGPATVNEVIPYLFYASWKSILFHVFIIAFSAYCVAVDSQYGMIRIGCTQPVSRAQYLLGKSIAIELHVALFALVYVASIFIWVCICTEFRGLSFPGLLALSSLAVRTVVFCVGLSGCMIGVSILRKTLLDAFVSCCVLFVGFGLLLTLPPEFHLRPVLFLRYFLYPIAGILPKGWPIQFPMKDAPFWQFLLVSMVTPTVCLIPAFVRFHFRDISE
jgi:ABC-type transport system involved in multi-copper enzyme maturation permease subunit